MFRIIFFYILFIIFVFSQEKDNGDEDNPERLVSIFIKSIDQKGVPDVKIEITSFLESSDDSSSVKVFKTDKKGKVSFELLPGEYILLIEREGYKVISEILTVLDIPLSLTRNLIKDSLKTLNTINVEVNKKRNQQKEQEFQGSLTILDRDKITELGIKESKDIAESITGIMDISSSGLGFSIRGISPMRAEPVIGYYVDGVPKTEITGNSGILFLADEINIYKGVQPTLFGRSFLGGVISIHTKKPQNKITGNMKMSFGNGFYQGYGGFVSAPIIKDRLFIIGSMDFSQLDGFYKNTITDNKTGGYTNLGASVSLKNFYKKLTFDFSYSYNQSDREPLPLGSSKVLMSKPPVLEIEQSLNNESQSKDHLVSFNVSHQFRFFLLRNIVSYRNYNYKHTLDYDFVGENFLISHQKKKNNIFMDELSFSYKDSSLDWRLGLFTFYAQRKYNEKLEKTKEAAIKYSVSEGFEEYDYTHNEINMALYGNVTYTFPIGIGLQGGMRYDFYYKDLDLTYFDRKETMVARKKVDYDLQKEIYNGYSPKIGIFYKFNNLINMYVNFTLGYRPGGINEIVSSSDNFYYDREMTFNYEVGAKFSFFNNILNMNISYFVIQWKDIQLFAFIKPRVFELIVQNGGEALSHGLEMNSVIYFFKDMFFELGFNYTNAQFLNGSIALVDHISGIESDVELKGKFLPFTPEFAGKIALQVGHKFVHKKYSLKPYFRIEYMANGGLYFSEKNLDKSDSYHLINFKTGLITDKVDVIFSFKNLLNIVQKTYSLELAGSILEDKIAVSNPFRFSTDVVVKF